MSKDDLNLKQRKFVNAYLENDGNATKSYIEAGYDGSKPSIDVKAHQLLKKPNVVNAINKERECRAKASLITFERKVGWLGDIAADGMQKIDVKTDTDGQDRTVMQDSRSSIAAISELNRMQGHHAATNSNINIQAVAFSQAIGDSGDLGSNDEKPVVGEVLDEDPSQASD